MRPKPINPKPKFPSRMEYDGPRRTGKSALDQGLDFIFSPFTALSDIVNQNAPIKNGGKYRVPQDMTKGYPKARPGKAAGAAVGKMAKNRKPKQAKPAGRTSIYNGTDASAKGGNKKLPLLGGVEYVNNGPGVQRGLARANAVAADMRKKGKGLRGQVTVATVSNPDEDAWKGPRYKEFKGSKQYMGGANVWSTLKKAPKGKVSK